MTSEDDNRIYLSIYLSHPLLLRRVHGLVLLFALKVLGSFVVLVSPCARHSGGSLGLASLWCGRASVFIGVCGVRHQCPQVLFANCVGVVIRVCSW